MKKTIIASTLALALSIFGAIQINNSTTSDVNSRQHKNLSQIEYTTGNEVLAKTHVKGYYKKNGTYVAPHTRSTPSEKYDKYGNYKG